MATEISKARYVAIAASSGFATGILAGLVGLGGAEERIPFILFGLKVPVYDMIVSNLLISFGTSGLNFSLRALAGYFPPSSVPISLAMIVGSVLGAFIGASIAHRVSERKLKAFVAFVLSLVVVRLTFEIFGSLQSTAVVVPAFASLALAGVLGLLVGIVSGSVGVAGGEYRIPLLIFVFGLPIKIAGTISQLVSLPTIAVGLYRHRSLGFLNSRNMTLAVVMGIPSLVGVAISQVILLAASDQVIRVVFDAILLYTIVRLLAELRIPSETGKSVQT